MPLSDLDLANLCQALYDGYKFDYTLHTAGVDYAINCLTDYSVAVFEGSHDVADWLSNFEAEMIQIDDLGGVEKGFYDGMESVVKQSLAIIPIAKPLYITGHSRGAAHALIFAAMMVKQGYNVVVVVFGSPRPGDATLAACLSKSPVRSYRNMHDFDDQDFVCDVPLPVPFEYVHPGTSIVIDVAPEANDSWLLLARHHMKLYVEGAKIYGESNPGK